MREVNNSVDISKIQQIRADLKANKTEGAEVVPQQQPDVKPEHDEKSVAFSGSEVLGRSQVAQADALNKDVTFAMDHPDAIERADKAFDLFYNKQIAAGKSPEDAYNFASKASAAYVKEFCV